MPNSENVMYQLVMVRDVYVVLMGRRTFPLMDLLLVNIIAQVFDLSRYYVDEL